MKRFNTIIECSNGVHYCDSRESDTGDWVPFDDANQYAEMLKAAQERIEELEKRATQAEATVSQQITQYNDLVFKNKAYTDNIEQLETQLLSQEADLASQKVELDMYLNAELERNKSE